MDDDVGDIVFIPGFGAKTGFCELSASNRSVAASNL